MPLDTDANMSGAGLWIARLFILPHVLVAIGLIVYPVLLGAAAVCGVETPAVLLEKNTGRDSDGDEYHRIKIDYTWQSEHYIETMHVSRVRYDRLAAGERLFVRFLPAFRTITQDIRTPGAPYEPPTVAAVSVYIIGTVLWIAIVGLFFLALYIVPFLNWWVLRYGRACTGEIKQLRVETKEEDGDIYRVDFVYTPGKRKSTLSSRLVEESYQPRDSRHSIRSSVVVSKETFLELAEGDRLSLLYLPLWPKVNVPLRS